MWAGTAVGREMALQMLRAAVAFGALVASVETTVDFVLRNGHLIRNKRTCQGLCAEQRAVSIISAATPMNTQ